MKKQFTILTLAFIIALAMSSVAGASSSTYNAPPSYLRFPLPQNYRLTTTYYDRYFENGVQVTYKYYLKHQETCTLVPGRFHWDIACPEGTEVLSPADGYVFKEGWAPDIGQFIYIKFDNGMLARFGHLRGEDAYLVLTGARVAAGQPIAYSGGADRAKGHSSGAHLHFQLFDTRMNPINPKDYIK